MQTSSRGAVCQICQKPLFNTWRSGEQLCCECGLSDELFHPDKRWMIAEGHAHQAPGVDQRAPKQGGAPARSTRLAILRLGLKVLAAIAPLAAQARRARLFFTPRP